MSTTIDQKVVEMKFDNSKFDSKVKDSIKVLENLKSTLSKATVTDGLSNLQTAANNFNLNGIATAVDSIADRFSTMGIVGATVISDLTTSALHAIGNIGSRMKNMITEGGFARASNIEKAKFQLEGLGIAYNDVMDAIDYAVTNTAYSLDAAASAASQLATAGLDYKDVIFTHKSDNKELTAMSMSLRAISGVAAQTQSDYAMVAQYFQDVATQGKITGSVLTRMTQVLNMPVKQNLADGLKAIADGSMEASESVQKTAKSIVKNGNVSVEEIEKACKKGIIDYDTFATIMFGKYADHAVAANNTLQGVTANIKSAFSKIGADLIEPIIANEGPLVKMLDLVRANINSIRKNLSPISSEIANGINANIIRMTNILEKIDMSKAFSGLSTDQVKKIFDAITALFYKIVSYTKPLKDAFNDVFGGNTGVQVSTFVDKLYNFITGIKNTTESLSKAKSAFRGFFSIFDIAKKTLGVVIDVIKDIASTFGAEFSSGILDGAASLGEMIYAFDEFLTTSGFFEKAATRISNAIKTIIFEFSWFINGGFIDQFKRQAKEYGTVWSIIHNGLGIFADIVRTIAEFIADLMGFDSELVGDKVNDILYGGIINPIANFGQKLVDVISNTDGFKGFIDKIKQMLTSITGIDLSGVSNSFKSFIEDSFKFEGLSDTFATVFGGILNVLGTIGTSIINVGSFIFEGIKAVISGIFDLLNNGDAGQALKNATLAAVFLNLKNFAIQIRKILDIFKGGNIQTSFNKIMVTFKDSMVDTFTEIQKSIKTTYLIKIAFALLVLAGAMYVISAIDGDKLAASFVVISALLYELVEVLKTMTKLSLGDNINSAATTMVVMSVAVYILASALKKVGDLDLKEIGKGLLALTGCMVIVVGAILILSRFSGKKDIIAMGGLIAMAIAVKILAGVVKDLANVEGSIGKGLLGLAGITLILVYFINMTKKVGGLNSIGLGLGLIAMAAAFKIMASVIKDLASVEGSIGKALGALTGIALIMALFTRISSGGLTVIGQGLGFLMIAASMKIMASVVKDLAELEGSMGRALGALTGIALIMAIFSRLASGVGMVVLGAGMLVMAVALKIFASALADIAAIESGLGKAVGVIAALLTIFTIFSALTTLVGPGLLMLSVSLIAIAAGLTMLLVPLAALGAMDNINKALLNLVKVLGVFVLAAIASIVVAPGLLILSIGLMALGTASVLVGEGMVLIGKGLIALTAGIAAIASIGPSLINGFINSIKLLIIGIITLIPQVMAGVAEAIVQLCEVINKSTPNILETIANVVNGILDLLIKLIPKFTMFATLLMTSIYMLIMMWIPKLRNIAASILDSILALIIEFAPKIIEIAWYLIETFLSSIAEHMPNIIQTGVDIIVALMEGIQSAQNQIIDKAVECIINFINGLSDTIENRTQDLADAFTRLFNVAVDAAVLVLTNNTFTFLKKGKELIDKLKEGFYSKKQELISKVISILNDCIQKIKEKFDDLKEAGKYILEGLKVGIEEKKEEILKKITDLGDSIKKAFNFSVNINSPSKDFAESGMYIMLGLIQGIEEYSDAAIKSVSEAGDEISSEANKMLANISNVLTDEADLTPVVRPTLDLTDVTTGVRKLNSMFENPSVGINQNGGTLGVNGANYNFIQNNYSPKALDRAEIYRQTRNQFSQMKGLVNSI